MPPFCKGVENGDRLEDKGPHRAMRGLQAPHRASAKGSSPPASTSASDGPWPNCSLSQDDLDMELAIALTNANINSGRIVCCATDETEDVTARRAEMFGSICHEIGLRGSRKRTTSPTGDGGNSCNRVAWALPIERLQGAGYSNRILQLSAVRRPCTPACPGCTADAVQGPSVQDSSAEPAEPAMVQARKPTIEQDAVTQRGKPRAHGCALTGRNLAQLRVDLFTRIGLPSSRESPQARRWKDEENERADVELSRID